MNNTTIEKLCAFGLSHNQAKVYCSIIESGCTNVKQISHATGIHSQDIYKTLTKLEENGLILKPYDKPIRVEAVPIKKGLNQLIFNMQKKSEQKIKRLKTYQEQIEEIACTEEKNVKEKKSPYIFVLEKENQAKIDLTFENIQIEYDLLLPSGPFKWIDYLEDQFKKLAEREVKIRILILTKSNENDLANKIKNIMPTKGDFEIRTLQKEDILITVIDFREVWIPITLKDKMATIVTNAEELVAIAKAHFEKSWNDPEAKIITSQHIESLVSALNGS